MLASNVQFSTYNQTPPTRPRQTHALPQETRRYEEQEGPDQRKTITPEGAARSLRTQQRAYRRPTPDTPFHTTPDPEGPDARRTRGSNSCRPNWSAFNPRAPPQELAAIRDWMTVMSWARLWTTSTRLAASAP